jgi:hypothetical protein
MAHAGRGSLLMKVAADHPQIRIDLAGMTRWVAIGMAGSASWAAWRR